MNILALDVGSSQIKCLVVETKWKRFDIVYHDVVRVIDALDENPQGEEILSPGQIQALVEIQRRYTNNIDRLVVNIPGALYSTRMLNFPFKDKKKIQAAVEFQIEDEIPFPLENCIVTSHIFSSKLKSAQVLTGVAPTAPLQKYLDSLQAIGLDPDVLLAEQPAYASLLGLQKNSVPNQSIAIVNLGHRKSSISIFREGIPALHRTSMNGGYQITKAIADKYDVSLAEAEVAKLDKAFLATPGMHLSPEQQAFSDVISRALDPVFHDFDQVLMAYTSRFNHVIDQIYLSGGCSLLPGLLESLNSRWNKRVLPFHVLTKIPHVSIRPQKSTELILPAAIAMGLSQVRSEFRTSINFRSGPLRRQQSAININWQEVIGPLKLGFVVYVFALISLSFQYLFLKRDFDAIQIKHDQVIKAVLAPPTSSAMTLLKANPTRLKQSVDRKTKDLEAQIKTPGRTAAQSTLDLIQILSSAVKANTKAEIKEFNLTGNQLSLRFEAPTDKDAENTIKSLTNLSAVSGVRASAVEAVSPGGRKKFSLNMLVNPPKDGS